MKWYLEVIRKYAVFSGRARRKEYWMFFLFNMIFNIAFTVLDGVVFGLEAVDDNGLFSTIYSLSVILPSLAAGVRRMHDQGKSGWFILIPIYNIVLLATDGDKGENEYGPDPKGEEVINNETLDAHLMS